MAEATLIVKGSVLAEEKPAETVNTPNYTADEQTYLGGLQRRLELAKTSRDQVHGEFDNVDYLNYWWANERGANTVIQYKKNKDDTVFQSGTLRTKMLAFLSTFLGLNLSPDITAFDANNFPVGALGEGIEDVMDKCEEMENDEEKKMLRWYELLKQGTVYVEDVWNEKYVMEKTASKGFEGKKDVKWSTKRVKGDSRPIRTIIPGTAVYLGDMSKYMIEDQPFIYTIQVIRYDEAKQIYGNWEMWDFVSKSKNAFSGNVGNEMVANCWRLLDSDSEKVEVIKYQDKINNEFQIILNGVPMLPMGYPLTEISPDGEYTLVQQNLEPIRDTFAIGKSFIFKNKNLVAVLDKMMQLGVLKTYKSYMPPYLNTSDRVLSRDVLSAGKITRGIQPGQLQPVSEQETKGVTQGEFNMIQEMTSLIDRNTVSQTTTGAMEQGERVTATQIMQLQRQAKVMMGLMTLSVSLLEKKLAYKRLALILKYWFEPTDQKVDEARGELKNRYRTVASERTISNEGQGVRMVIPTEKIPKPGEIRMLEEEATKRMGVPIRMIMLNPKELKKARLVWVININPKEKKSSEFNKIMFQEMVMGAVNLGFPINPDWGMERYAQIWEEDPGKMFNRGTVPQPGVEPSGTMSQGMQGAGQAQKGVKQGIMPKPETASPKGVL
jgi:hypothetical protein